MRAVSDASGSGAFARFARAVLGAGTAKIANALLVLATSVLLARVLGADGYGVYSFAFALVSVLAIPAHAGIPTLVTREVAKYHLRSDWAMLRGLVRRANQLVVLFAAVVVPATAAVMYVASRFGERPFAGTIAWALLLIPLIALGKVRAAALAGYRRVVQAQLPELLVTPALLLTFTAIAAGARPLTPEIAMALHGLAAVIAFGVGMALLARATPAEVQAAPPRYETRAWLQSVLPISFIAGMQILNTQASLLTLGAFNSPAEVAHYRVATQIASVVSLILMVTNAVIAPQISRSYHAGNTAELQTITTWSARVTALAAVPLAIVIALFGRELLRLAFGAQFEAAYAPLLLLTGAQLVNALMGSVALLLNMTGHERDTARALLISAVLTVVLTLALTPAFGTTGAATATTIGIAVWNTLLYRRVKERLGISSLAIGVRRRRTLQPSAPRDAG
jgi:O-antigen/teichoic acid export membrane protein